ncbi:MAG: hypothetical protein WBO17_07515 [Sphingorhabdus sp.]
MEQKVTNDDILILDNALIFNTEQGGESAIEYEADVLLLTNALPPEPIVKRIDVGPRISAFELRAPRADSDRPINPGIVSGWNVAETSKHGRAMVKEPSLVLNPLVSEKEPSPIVLHQVAQLGSGDVEPLDLAPLLAEARGLATEYGVMNLRTRNALYAALGRTYDIAFYADSQPEAYSRLVKESGLTIQDRAPYTPIIKLVFGADYDKTRVAEFAAAIMYGRRKDISPGSFSSFLETFAGGLKAVVGLERLMRKGNEHASTESTRNQVHSTITRKLRAISLQTWGDLSSRGDEFALLMARRLPDGSIAIVGEVPRDIALLEKAARKLLADVGRTNEDQTIEQANYTEVV